MPSRDDTLQGFDKPAVGFWFWLEGLIDIFFYTDLILNFFTAYEASPASLFTRQSCVRYAVGPPALAPLRPPFPLWSI